MADILHILTRPDDLIAVRVIEIQRARATGQVRVADLSRSEPDYDALLEEIFSADSVQVW